MFVDVTYCGDVVLTCGDNGHGQGGHGNKHSRATKPRRIEEGLPKGSKIRQVAAGGMHSVVLTTAGSIYTFGVGDEGALGRTLASTGVDTSGGSSSHSSESLLDPDEKEKIPGLVEFGELLHGTAIKMVSAGDSHTAALTDDGRVLAWGTFRVRIFIIRWVSRIPRV